MNKKIWVYILSAIFFVSMAVLGVSTVYRVDTVTVNAIVVSDVAKKDAEELQYRLSEVYERNSIFFVDDEPTKEIMTGFSHFRLISFRKVYPNRLVVEVKEDTELFAVPVMDGSGNYYILGPDGLVLGVRDSYVNRLDGANNLLLTGLSVTGEKDGALIGDEYLSTLIEFCQKASEVLGGIRCNVISVEVIRMTTSVEETVFRINTREGVRIYIGYPKSNTEEKAQVAFEKYLSLSPEKRIKGRIAVSDKLGEVIVSYAEKDDFFL